MTPVPAGTGTELDVSQRVANLRLILGSMAGGILFLSGVAVLFYLTRPALVPTAAAFKVMTAASAVDAALVLLLYPASRVVFSAVWRSPKPAPAARLQSAYTLSTALREVSGLVGAMTILLGVFNGAVAARPLYWLNLASPALFALTIYLSLPTEGAFRIRLAAAETPL